MLTFSAVLENTQRNLDAINQHGNLGYVGDAFQGFYRRAYSEAEFNVKKLIADIAAQEYGAEVQWDRAGNVHLTIPGSSGKFIAFGSHPDTVHGGGAYDGSLGLVDGLEILGAASRMKNRNLGVRLIIIGGEENSFGRSLKCSAMLHGEFEEQYLSGLNKEPDGTQVSLEQAMLLQGADPQAIKDRAVLFHEVGGENCVGYCEFHIEQGLRLKEAGVPVGIVHAISGSTRPKIELIGEGGHTSVDRIGNSIRNGEEPAPSRDALEVFARGYTDVLNYRNEMMRKHTDLTIACGSAPQIGGGQTGYVDAVIPAIDIRSAHDALRGEVAEKVVEMFGVHAMSQAVTLVESQRPSIPGLPNLDRDFVALMQASSSGVGVQSALIQSRASHDALYFGLKDIPTIMLFVRDQLGISHKPGELADMADNAQAVLVGWEFYQRLNAQYAA